MVAPARPTWLTRLKLAHATPPPHSKGSTGEHHANPRGRGLKPRPRCRTIAPMRKAQDSSVRRFKGETVYDWSSEPADERPTEFGSSTGYSQLSGFSHSTLNSSLEFQRARRRARSSSRYLWVVAGLVLAAVTTSVMALAKVLRA